VLFECVINISEGRDPATLSALSAAAGPSLLDRHSDPDHHRSVFTLAGPGDDVAAAARSLAAEAVRRLDLTGHSGAHPRLGVLDVVPFVPFTPDSDLVTSPDPDPDPKAAVPLRDAFAQWLGTTLGVPSFLYGPLPGGHHRSLPEVRQHAFTDLTPDFGPDRPHPTAGATAVGARGVLVAYNVWVTTLSAARAVAPLVRGPMIRTLGLEVGARAQVSCNLIRPSDYGPAQAYDDIARATEQAGGEVTGAELVGLLPGSVLRAVPESRWVELDLSAEATLEARLATRR
jgi:glutamate formiminotransferase / 5-formyltetrahydrofolate cyclo-ligase